MYLQSKIIMLFYCFQSVTDICRHVASLISYHSHLFNVTFIHILHCFSANGLSINCKKAHFTQLQTKDCDFEFCSIIN